MASHAPRKPRISVCATHLNDGPALRAWANSLLPQAPPDAEFVIVDAGSRPESRRILDKLQARDPRVRVIVRPGACRGLGRDVAWREARADVILHTDTDRVWLPTGWARVEALVPRLSKGPILLRTPLGAITLGGFLFARHHLLAVNGYDPTLQYFEDTDILRRLERRFTVQDEPFHVYQHDDKRKMRSIRTNFRYHRDMFFDAARIGNPLGYMFRPSRLRPWRYPFLVRGWFAYRRGRRAPPARCRAERAPPT